MEQVRARRGRTLPRHQRWRRDRYDRRRDQQIALHAGVAAEAVPNGDVGVASRKVRQRHVRRDMHIQIGMVVGEAAKRGASQVSAKNAVVLTVKSP
jgi:hypothetical protein